MYQKAVHSQQSSQQQSDDDDDSENEVNYQHGAVLNLLDFSSSNHWKNSGRNSLSNLTPNSIEALSRLAHVSTNDPNSRGNMINSSNVSASDNNTADKMEISITKIFEPKFMIVYNKYVAAMGNAPNLTKHLLSVCLEHLIDFSCWARENTAQCQWLHETLDENPDLRPEVRNGLAMILIYCFSSAQASLQTEADMFSVLQDAENGMGIVNKTSLKIYNDPFNYFNFLKACISGLIDAGKIPENERQNQPKKPKRTTENKDEINAFTQLQQCVTTWLQQGDHALARSKIRQIIDIWQQKQKGIRSRRFVTALVLISSPQSGANILANHRSLLMNASPFSPRMYDTYPTNNNAPLSTEVSGLTPLTAMADIYDPSATDANGTNPTINATTLAAANALLVSAGIDPAVLATQTTSIAASGMTPIAGNNHSILTAAQIVRQRQLQQQQQQNANIHRLNTPSSSLITNNNNTTTTYDDNNMSSNNAPNNFFPHPPSKFLRTSMTPSAGAGHPHHQQQINVLNANTSTDNSSSSPPITQIKPLISINTNFAHNATHNNNNSNVHHGISVLRFERIAGKEWDYKEIKVFNIDALLQDYPGTFWLLDESKLSPEEKQTMKMNSHLSFAGGLISLTHELQQRQALITSWPKNDHEHLRDFLYFWLNSINNNPNNAETNNNISSTNNESSLLHYWQRHSINSAFSHNIAESAATASSSSMAVDTDNSNTNSSLGQGILAYEVVIQVGIVLRTSASLGIAEDCWRLVYPQDLQSFCTSASTTSFAQFLAKVFPQIRVPLAKIVDFSTIIVKYHAHPLGVMAVTQPPKWDDAASIAYQTIGMLDESLETVLGRFETSYLAFHDIVLSAT